MFWAIVLASSLMIGSPEATTPPPGEYEAARARAGRDPAAHVRLALWCEAHGLSSEKLKHLALALLNEPKNATARGLLGPVAYRAQWKIRIGEETVVATEIHRFWKAGRGWTMARDLKPGDPIRTLGGLARVESVESDRIQPVFNLQVAEGESFLVGKQGALVHDNSLVQPVANPFDAEPGAALAGSGNR
jgi:hypothetical protein